MRSDQFTRLLIVLATASPPADTRAPSKKGQAKYNRAADKHDFTVFMREGGWRWFQDPRAIIRDGNLFLGSGQGNGSGPALVGVYSLKQQRSLGTSIMLDGFDRDDHNSPVFHIRPDGSVLAVYARHGREKIHHFRISDAKAPLQWSDPMTFRHDYPKAGRVTYINLLELRRVDRLYNFFRGIKFNPSFIVSTDHGKSWDSPTRFIESKLEGRHRPYARYAGNETDTVHVCFTDGHPNQFGNNIYYAAFRNGKFRCADGSEIKHLQTKPPCVHPKPNSSSRAVRNGRPKDAPAPNVRPGRVPSRLMTAAILTSPIRFT